MKYISINDISFSYNDNNVYNHYSVAFPMGEVSTIMSPSGSGKTTLLYLIAGLLKPDSGTITYPMDSPRFSMVFQDLRLIDNISVEKNIRLVCSNISHVQLNMCLNALGLDKLAHRKVRNLSGGEKQLVAIARALMAEYDILLLDEPFTGLDDNKKNLVINYIKTVAKGKTILLVTHDKNEAIQL